MKTLIVVDMQNDFINGALGTPEAVAIVPKVKKKIEEYRARGDQIIFTRDTHFDDYLETLEGQHLPVKHCVKNTYGWELADGIDIYEDDFWINKYQFGVPDWLVAPIKDDIEMVGLCSDICVIANAINLKTQCREREVTVDASCCAGTTPENHKAALQVMKSCQINVIGE